jgi:hypothetical protein
MKVRILSLIESDNLVKNETNTLFELSADRTDAVSGGFQDNWDSVVSSNANNSPTPFKLISYRLRVYTNQPCVIWSACAENLRVAKLSPSGVDTDFNQRSTANGIVKKWNITSGGGFWSTLQARPKNPKGTGPQRFNDATWKLQIKNINPAYNIEYEASYYACIEAVIDYDATSPL